MSILITNGRLIDQAGDRAADVRVDAGTIVEVGTGLQPADGDDVIDASGLVVSPGFVDLHVHLREPGREEADQWITDARRYIAARNALDRIETIALMEPRIAERQRQREEAAENAGTENEPE